ncbi:DUF4260 domain-containing protein [Halobacillus shinanisalinarum]|uniref:DUF4260 domain-containing protein n=1 Tax=Halobacillus shinanisalinarum TaxID=2932258 RepID=A0ABY4H381_9BACI|nr:DUF4260 domain-containing protein [Halobacillus shinanisalinarum]UOQ94918.1 DUF4260 domain-containing protein [Halobacillus shinanisalinarum]
MNKALLHIEGLAALILSIYFYAQTDASWLMFALLLLAPDLSALGYIINNKIGAYTYNAFHTYTPPLLIILISTSLKTDTLLLSLGLIWATHIAMDRMIGYGLKDPSDPKITHLQKL